MTEGLGGDAEVSRVNEVNKNLHRIVVDEGILGLSSKYDTIEISRECQELEQ